MKPEHETMFLSVVLPCLNEARTLGACIQEVQRATQDRGREVEIIVADNGSCDGSQSIALEMEATLIEIEKKGYGSTLKGGFSACTGRYVLFADSDGSYDFSTIPLFVEALEQGYDLVVGNRFQGLILPGAMPALHYYLGNPLLSFLGRLLFSTDLGDFHCGLRAFRREAMEALNLQCDGMEFASEMIAKAVTGGLTTTEVPITLSPDGRGRRSHLNTWSDGWRHLSFMLGYAFECYQDRRVKVSRE